MSVGTVAPATAAEAVANGAQLLDEKMPGWWRQINLETLDLVKCESCVCGQLAHGLLLPETTTMDYLFLGEASKQYMRFLEHVLGIDSDCEYGFNHFAECDERGLYTRRWLFSELDEEWQKVIRARLDADRLTTETPVRKEKVTA